MGVVCLEVTDELCFLRVIQNMSRKLEADQMVSSVRSADIEVSHN